MGIWDTRLITPARAFELTMNTPLWLDVVDGQAHLRCAVTIDRDGTDQACDQSVGLFWSATAAPMATATDDIVAAVLRHLVMAHDISLSGGNNERAKRAGSTAGDSGRVAPAADSGRADCVVRPGAAGDRSRYQA